MIGVKRLYYGFIDVIIMDISPPPGLKLKVISRDGHIIDTSDCYFGVEYSNAVGENVLSIVTNNFIADKDTYGLGEYDDENVKSFFALLGVSDYPRIEHREFDHEQIAIFDQYHREKYDEYECTNGEHFSWSSFRWIKCNIATFIDLEEILENASFEDILAWFASDIRVQDMLAVDHEVY